MIKQGTCIRPLQILEMLTTGKGRGMICFPANFPSLASYSTVLFLLGMLHQDLKRVIPVSRHSEIEFCLLPVKCVAGRLLLNAPFLPAFALLRIVRKLAQQTLGVSQSGFGHEIPGLKTGCVEFTQAQEGSVEELPLCNTTGGSR